MLYRISNVNLLKRRFKISLKPGPDLLEFRFVQVSLRKERQKQEIQYQDLSKEVTIPQERVDEIFDGAADFKQLGIEQIEAREEKIASRVWKGGFLFAAVMSVFALYVWNFRNRHRAEHKARKVEVLGRAHLDGKFDLIRTKDGEPFSTDDLLGKWSIIYFGFTRCPDVCPEQLEKLAYVVQSIEASKENPKSDFHDVEVVPIFISIDCRRDTFEEINEYCESFHPSLVGLSGTEQQVDNAAKSFRLYFSKGMVDENDPEYLMDHTVVLFLLNPENKVQEYFTQRKSPGQIIFETHSAIRKYKTEIDFATKMMELQARREEKKRKRQNLASS